IAHTYLVQETEPFSLVSSTTNTGTEGPTWLVERRRPSATTKFTGTMSHQARRTDRLSAIIHAFSHFVYGYSKGKLLSCAPARLTVHIKGTLTNIEGKDIMVLFDLMTHTESVSGVGDWGDEGIRTYIDEHDCQDLCKNLGLNDMYPLTQEVPVEADDVEADSNSS
ncbi:kinase-like domain-containing protein, partial [Rhodocollybia butyracea]